MSGIVNAAKEALAPEGSYPAPSFVITPGNPALFAEQQEQNQPGERPGKQDKLQLVRGRV